MTLQLYVGQTNLRGAIAKYASRFNLLELRGDTGRLPRNSVLQRWSDDVSEKFVFSLLLNREIGRFTGDQEAMVKDAIAAAAALKARWMVLQTDPTLGPSQRSRQRLVALFSRLIDSGRRVAWEPHGVWQDDEARAYAGEFGVHCVRDIGRGDPVGDQVIYSRMPGLGTAARLSVGVLEKAARSLVNATEAYIVVGGDGARKLQQLLPGFIGTASEDGIRGADTFNTVTVFGGFTSQQEPKSLDDEEYSYEQDPLSEVEDQDNDTLDDVESQANSAAGEDDEDSDDEDEDEENDEDPVGSPHNAQDRKHRLSKNKLHKEPGRR